MASSASFGAMLSRLLTHRGSDTGEMAVAAGVPESELAAVLSGVEPSAPLLRGLAPALDLHTSDLFLIAGHPVPDDLAPTGYSMPGVEPLVYHLAMFPEVGHRLL